MPSAGWTSATTGESDQHGIGLHCETETLQLVVTELTKDSRSRQSSPQDSIERKCSMNAWSRNDQPRIAHENEAER